MKTCDEGDKILNSLNLTDSEFAERFKYFAFDQVPNIKDFGLTPYYRHLAIVCALLGSSSLDLYREFLPASLDGALTPIQVKEILYQASAYLGFGKVLPFITASNEIFTMLGISLPLEEQGTTTIGNRREKGTQTQVDIFGEHMRDFYKNGPAERVHINYLLASNCFGDYYTRKGLDLKDRELVTFCLLASFGGVEPQLTSHAKANIKMGNDPKLLMAAITQMVPYIGYPRTLNAISCLEKAQQ